jgi:hypothetical protein
MKRGRALSLAFSIALLFLFSAWLRMYLPVHYESAATWGKELDATGHVLRSIDLQRSYRVTGWLPGPEGGHQTRTVTNHYFLNRSGKPQKELTFLPTLEEAYIDGEFLPVTGTSAWVMKTNPKLEERLILIVFDDNGLLHRREIPVTSKPFSSSEPGLDYQFSNGNRTMHFQYLGRSGIYDVMTDTIK